ncbi:A/G-specific adenine glycosylase [Leptospira fletcheri]|uniref:Adenine DNA glycosylase n=1 Tax=Leptospira fletcheri TaxID=2484981 RepID=A0A4R9G4W9_9LEPT|nr:A/G-specific adenine glycosylase [Leptospira fletcheri]TGK06185.1 A/G-specific adenine glycosylase [Leptospira fletcheri]
METSTFDPTRGEIGDLDSIQRSEKKLRDWFFREKRDLPFRRNRTPYSTWVSEVMLQQTRVAAMIPIYEAFLKRFPTPSDLAHAEEEEVLQYWKGLGYYSRAKNLQKGMRKLVQEFDGVFPRTLESALSLPGIGPYTGRAVLSISYNLPFAVLDGNAKRVLSRFFLFRGNISKSDSILQEIADRFLDRKHAGDHNEAVMELGARICLPARPLCAQCPLSQDCRAFREGAQNEIPVPEKKAREIPLGMRFLIVRAPEGILLLRYSERRFFKTIFSLPFDWEGDSPYDPDPNIDLGIEFSNTGSEFKHTITHHKIRGSIWESVLGSDEARRLEERLLREKKEFGVEWKWCSWADLENGFPSSVAKKIRRALSVSEGELPGISRGKNLSKNRREE